MRYLLKEATPQAQYRRAFRRISGSIPLGELGGNRVILSDDLRDILVRSGRIEPYTRSYARRQLKRQAQQPPDGVAPNPMAVELARVA
jgi:hypothetical protein